MLRSDKQGHTDAGERFTPATVVGVSKYVKSIIQDVISIIINVIIIRYLYAQGNNKNYTQALTKNNLILKPGFHYPS